MDINAFGFAYAHLLDENARYWPAPRSASHAALLVFAGMSLLRPHALLGTPITALASAYYCRF